MKKQLLFIALSIATISLQAQTGKVGINTANPNGTFHIDGKKDNPAAGIPDSAQVLNDFIVTDSGAVGIGTINPYMKLDVVGAVKGNNYSAFNPSFHPFFFNYGASGGTWENPGYIKSGVAMGAWVSRDAKSFQNSRMPGKIGKYGGSDIYIFATENFTDTNKGSDMAFYTTSNGTDYSQMRLYIAHDGNVGIGYNTKGANPYTLKQKLEVNGKVKAANVIFTGIPTYANDAAAATGGLVAGEMYKTSAGVLMIKL